METNEALIGPVEIALTHKGFPSNRGTDPSLDPPAPTSQLD
jgi:hypothetical protein